MKKYILVTGATGFLGAETCKRLINLGYKVVGIGRKRYGFLSDAILHSENFTFIQLDLKELDETFLQDIIFDSCIHLASIVEYASHDYHDYHDCTIIPTLNLLKIAKLGRIKHIIYSSTLSVITKPESKIINEESAISPSSNYGLAKYTCEKLLEIENKKNSSFSCTTLRFPSIYGKNHLGGIVHTLKESAINNEEIELYGRGEYLRNILYVEDAIDSIILALTKKISGFQLFNIGSDTSIRVIDIANTLIKLLHSQSILRLSDKTSPNNFNAQLDITKAKNLLSFQPRDIKEGLKLYIQDIQNQHKET